MSSTCPNKNVCGSCEWSSLPYEEQLSKKLDEVNKSFIESGLNYKVRGILSSPKTSHYRNRMDFVIDYQGKFGLREKGKWWKVIDNHTCFISDAKIEEAFHECYGWVKECGLSYLDRKTHKGLLSYIVIRCTTTGELMINVVTSGDFPESQTGLIEKSIARLNATTVLWSINRSDSDVSFGEEVRVIKGNGYIQEEINGFKYQIAPNAFFQTNSLSAENLQRVVVDFARKSSASNILDLYCGSGFFTIPLAKVGGHTVGVEVEESSIATARINAINNNVQPEFVCDKSENLSWGGGGADLVVVDPPRVGLHTNVLDTLVNRKPKNIIYVSCNYRNFIKELQKFSAYYNIEDSIAVDMFPQTHHVELVTLMTLK